MRSFITTMQPNRRKKNPEEMKKRKVTLLYRLPTNDGQDMIPVCQKTFLATFGFKHTKVLEVVVGGIHRDGVSYFPKERRGGNQRKEVDKESLRMHIESYKPCVAHYRRYNAPYTRYISREISVKDMWEDFRERFPEENCSLCSYGEMLRAMKISNKMPKSDVCEYCNVFKLEDSEGSATDLEEQEYQFHRQMAEKARIQLQRDVKDSFAPKTLVFTVDMQKVLILPIMPAVKESFFMSRLVCFNETFVPAKSRTTGSAPLPAYCIVWHEATYGRSADAVASAYHALIDEHRDTDEFIFYADNCSGQNKNYILFSMLVRISNEPWAPAKITIKYLTKGHTHMSADGLHGLIEAKIRKNRNVEDFGALKKLMEDSRENTRVRELCLSDFREWKNEKSSKKKKDNQPVLLQKIVEVVFKKGESSMFYREDFDQELVSYDFLTVAAKKELGKGLPKSLKQPRGINASKKGEIMTKLVPHMRDQRSREFWKKIPTEDKASADLTFEGCEEQDGL